MLKMSTDLTRHALNGPTMGTRWSALFHMPAGFDEAPVRAALAAGVAKAVQVSTPLAYGVPAAMPFALLGNSFLSRFQMRRDNDVLRLDLR